MTRRDALDRAFGRTHDAIERELGTTLEVYQPTESTDHAGNDTSYPSSPNDSVEGFVADPTEDPSVDPSGTDVDLDAIAYVAGDTGVTFDAYDVGGEGATELKDTRNGDRYRVATKITSHGDVLKLGLVGSDT